MARADSAHAGNPKPRCAGRRWPRRLAIAGLLAAALVVLLGLLVAHRPAFTRASLPTAADGRRAAGRLTSKASALVAGCERPGEWGASFTEEEANAWLAFDLPQIAPGLLPGGIRDPTVHFLPRRLAVSAALGAGPVSAHLWALLSVTLRNDNVLGVGVDSAGLGAIPLPPAMLLRTIADRASAAGAATEIRSLDGRPVLLVTLPGTTGRTASHGPEYHLEGVRLDTGELVLAGSTRMAATGRAR